jgi:hypothetical protein
LVGCASGSSVFTLASPDGHGGRTYAPLPRSAPAADALEFLLEIIVGLFHRLIGRAPFLNTLHTLSGRLPMTYRALLTVALAFANTLRERGGQNDLQVQPRAIWRDKNCAPRALTTIKANNASIPNKIECMAAPLSRRPRPGVYTSQAGILADCGERRGPIEGEPSTQFARPQARQSPAREDLDHL